MFNLETTGQQRMAMGYWQAHKSIGVHQFVEVRQQSFYARQFANPRFGRDFPGAGGADQHFVRTERNNSARFSRKPLVIRALPQQRVRIEQQPHSPFQAASSTSGSASKNPESSISGTRPGLRLSSS